MLSGRQKKKAANAEDFQAGVLPRKLRMIVTLKNTNPKASKAKGSASHDQRTWTKVVSCQAVPVAKGKLDSAAGFVRISMVMLVANASMMDGPAPADMELYKA